MFTRNQITTFTGIYSEQIKKLREKIQTSDAILIGAGAGLSEAAGLSYSGARFEKHFGDFHKKYGITDMYSGGFYNYKTPEEFWGWWSRHIYINRYAEPAAELYKELLSLVEDENYFVLTTNADHQFQKTGFDKKRLFYTQGDYGLWQCSEVCTDKTFDNENEVRLMMEYEKDMRIPTELVPMCPICKKPMKMNLRCDESFVQDSGWYAAQSRYEEFTSRYENSSILYLELGVGANTPGIIKYPFWINVASNEKAAYACINRGEAFCPSAIKERSICIDADILKAVSDLKA